MDLMDYRRKIIANSPHLSSASGAVASFSDGADLPLKSLNVDIKPVQSGSGDSSPTNIRPISGWNGVKVTRTGKNLLDTSVMHSGLLALTVGASEDSVTQSSRYGYSDRIPSTSAMVISARSDDTTNYNWIRVIQYVNGIVVAVIGGFEDIESTKTLAIPARENSYIRVVYGAKPSGAVSTSVIGYTQVELSSTATPYEPYNGVTVTINLGQTVYGGTLNPLTGVLTVDRAYAELTKNSAWSWNANNALVYCPVSRAVIVNVDNQRDVLIKNNMFTNSAWIGRGTLEYACGLYFGASYVFVKSTNHIASLEDFKAIIGDNTLQVVYPLATPVEIQLTPHQIRSLYGNNTIFADTGNVALEYWAHP